MDNIKILGHIFTSESENSNLSAVLCRRGEWNYKVGVADPQSGIFHAMICGWVAPGESFSEAFIRVAEESIGKVIVLQERLTIGEENPKYIFRSEGLVSEIFEIPGRLHERCFVSVVPWQQFLKIHPDVSSAGIRLVRQHDRVTSFMGGVDSLEETAMNQDGIDLMQRGFEYFAQQGVVY